MKKVVIIFLGIITLISCGTVENLESVNPVYSYLPLNTANKWLYKLQSDTSRMLVENNIKNNVRHSDGTILWGYNQNDQIIVGDEEGDYIVFESLREENHIRGYYGYRDSAIYYYSLTDESIGYDGKPNCVKIPLLKSPLEVGNQWTSENGFKSRIAYKGPIIVRSISYPNTVLVTTNHQNRIDSIWYSENVGIIKKIQYVATDTIRFTSFRRKLLELKSYAIKR
jgi:hypothetical protein